MTNDHKTWTIDQSKYLVDDKYLRLRVDSCTTPSGTKVDTYYVLELGDWVNCIAIDSQDNIVMLRHYRHGIQSYLLEFIGGGIEATDASPEAAARREAQEEAGYTGGTFYHVGTGYPNPANHTNKVHTFLAIGGSINQKQELEAGETLTIQKVPFKDVVKQMSASNTMYPSLYIAALFYAVNFIRSSQNPAVAHLKKYL
jgi:8-oxo-dGTP pyrophosphatase MutT (NUDIX family)